MLKNRVLKIFAFLAIGMYGSVHAKGASSEFRGWRALDGADFETVEGGSECSSGGFVFNEKNGIIMIRLGPTIQFHYSIADRNAAKRVERGGATRCRYQTSLELKEDSLRQVTRATGCLNSLDNSVTEQELKILSDDRLSYSSVSTPRKGSKKEIRCVFKKTNET